MSVQFGRWNFDGRPPAPDYVERVWAVLAPYGPDGDDFYSVGGVSILYRAFHTTKESRSETQPHVTSPNAVITWDGRLDNRGELIRQLRDMLSADLTDVSVVAAAYKRWGTDCFARLIGDWALSIWSPSEHFLILAKDPVGTRHLYYSFDRNEVTWSTILDPVVLFAERADALNEEYIAGWFSHFPATDLTPYVGIHSVPPSSFVLLRPGRQTVEAYWDFDPDKRIRYRTDAEYEEHFSDVFAESIRRRLRSNAPILAELSGGMDSSSIVCVADTVIARGVAEAPRLDTISYYDDSEPNWNERPYFTKVEERRGCTGWHIDVSSQKILKCELESDRFAATPGTRGLSSDADSQFAACMNAKGNRVVLSGIGGDEVMGGVPTPTPELADLLVTARFRALTHQLKVWALNKRKPWFHLFFETVRGFLPPLLVGVPKDKRPPSWLDPDFVRRHRAPLIGYEHRLKLFSALPSFQENLSTLDVLRRQLGSFPLPWEPPYEKRYPYLDRDLLEFIYAIPREQLVRPGQRRSLMRRALMGIVPVELLNRKRKAYVARAPMAAISTESETLLETSQHMVSSSLGIVDVQRFSEVLRRARHGQEVPLIPVIRTLAIESWLRGLDKSNPSSLLALKSATPIHA